jgi:hypothetical protein
MRRGVALAVALAALAAGCSKPEIGRPWVRPGTGINEATTDEITCARAAQEQTAIDGTIVGGLVDLALYGIQENQRQRLFERCMVVKGYAPPA